MGRDPDPAGAGRVALPMARHCAAYGLFMFGNQSVSRYVVVPACTPNALRRRRRRSAARPPQGTARRGVGGPDVARRPPCEARGSAIRKPRVGI